MFIDNINHQNINTKINLIDINKKTPPTESDKFNEKFMDYVKIGLEKASTNQNQTNTNSEKFTFDQLGTSLSDIMINVEKSSISMQMAIQIRNKVVSAYQEIMSQQV